MEEKRPFRIVIMVSGGGTNLQAIIDEMEAKRLPGTELCCVISNNKDAYAIERAKKHGISSKCISPSDFEDKKSFEEALLNELLSLNPDLIVLAGYLLILPKEVVHAFSGRIINIHPSLIPSFCGKGYYGLRVHEAALKRGVKVSGATVHFVDEGTDTGPILLQKAVEVREDDTPNTLQRRIMEEAEWKLLPEAIRMISAKRDLGKKEEI